MDILGQRSASLNWKPVGLPAAKQLEPCFNVHVCRIKFGCTLVRIERIVDLIVARFIL